MAAFPNLVLTNAGIALQNKVQGGATLELTNIQMGSGQLNGQPIGPLTALISSNATVPIQGGQAIGQNTYQVEGFFTNADLSAGFWWREIGIFANDPDNGEILYAYANAGDAGDYIPTVTDQRIEKYIYFSMALANATTVNVTIPQTDTFVLKTEVGQPNGVAGLAENGAVPIPQGGTGETTVQGVVDVFGMFLALSAAAAYDLEGSYAVGDYCTHGGKLHKCSTPIESGEVWNAAHWTETTVAAELAGKANAMPVQVRSLPLKSGLSENMDCTFFKIQESVVFVVGGVSGTFPANTDTQIGTLPEGFYPGSNVRRVAVTNVGSAYVEIRTDGTVWVHPFVTGAQCWFAAQFVAVA